MTRDKKVMHACISICARYVNTNGFDKCLSKQGGMRISPVKILDLLIFQIQGGARSLERTRAAAYKIVVEIYISFAHSVVMVGWQYISFAAVDRPCSACCSSFSLILIFDHSDNSLYT